MTLPVLFEPSGLPMFLAADHGIDPQDVYSTQQRATGHRRKRRVYTSAPRIVSVSRLLTPAQAVDYDDWFERLIVVGETHFTAEVANQGPGQVWFECCWVSPYQMTPIATPKGIYWRMVGELLLLGEGQAERDLDGDLAAEFTAHLTGRTSVTVPVALEIEYSAHLSPAILLSVEYRADLNQETPRFLLIGGGFRLLIGGGHRLRIE